MATNEPSQEQRIDELKRRTDALERSNDEQERRTDEQEEEFSAKQKAENTYQETKTKLKGSLKEFYRKTHSTIPLSPFIEEYDTPLLNFYQTPEMKVVENGKQKTTIKSLSALYKPGVKSNREVYITAEAGIGKTAFSKYLTVLWSQAHFPDKEYTKYLNEESVNAMCEFEFLFLVLLRYSPKDCNTDNLIFKQVVRYLPSDFNKQFLQKILRNERCLVVLDGLDEWSHPLKCNERQRQNIPHHNNNNTNCFYLTTTRPWKFYTLHLRTRQISKRIELINLNSESSLKLTTRALEIITNERDQKKIEKDANELVEKCKDFEQISSPRLLTYLVCLWHDGIQIGPTKCDLYVRIIELRLTTLRNFETKHKTCVFDIPQCFKGQIYCENNFTFLISLGKLAFKTLINEKREKSLVFDTSIAEAYLARDFLDLGRRTGIITQEKTKRLTSEKDITSFSHKTVQEFFAALYISTCPDKDDVLTFNSLQDILYLSEVLIFISGINAKLFSSLSKQLMDVINKDVITSKYRSTRELFSWGHPLLDIQNMFVSCITESPGTDVNICLRDFFFVQNCEQENYYTSLQRLAKHNKTNIKSIYIDNEAGQSLSSIIDSCELSDPEIHCQKITCWHDCKEEEILRLLSNSVKHLDIYYMKEDDARNSLTDEQCESFNNFSQLETIHIQLCKVGQQFLNYIINVKSIKEIKLEQLEYSGPGNLNFDLSKHSELRKLELFNSDFTFCDTKDFLLLYKMRNIEYLEFMMMKMPGSLLGRLVEMIKHLEHLVTVKLSNCTITPAEDFGKIRNSILNAPKSFKVNKDDRDDRDDRFLEFEFVTQK